MNTESNNPPKCAMALSALKNVFDPEIGLSVVDLGLIYQMDFDDPAKQITCAMTLTTEFCPMGESITDNVKITLEELFTGYEAEIHLTFTPPWDATMISEEGRAFLGN